MKKILTIFDRDWEGRRGVVNKAIRGLELDQLKNAAATEKIDGMNIRLTLRAGEVVRVEKRRNPPKAQKARGISEPWYMDADPNDSADQYIFDAVTQSELSAVPDGEWSAEAYGEKIQGNPLGLQGHRVFLFSLPGERDRITFEDVPTDFEGLRIWLNKAESRLHPGHPIEGLVWHFPDGRLYKIKRKDFK